MLFPRVLHTVCGMEETHFFPKKLLVYAVQSGPACRPGLPLVHLGLLVLQARQYMQMLPKEKQPVAGSEGAQYRKKQLAKQLPAHDQDPSKCHELSPKEVKEMEQFVKKYKNEALGVGDVKLPYEMGTPGIDKLYLPAGDRGTPTVTGAAESKSAEQKRTQYVSAVAGFMCHSFFPLL